MQVCPENHYADAVLIRFVHLGLQIATGFGMEDHDILRRHLGDKALERF